MNSQYHIAKQQGKDGYIYHCRWSLHILALYSSPTGCKKYKETKIIYRDKDWKHEINCGSPDLL